MTLFFQCGSFDVWRKLRELRSATLGMESRKANISSFVLRGEYPVDSLPESHVFLKFFDF